MSGKLWAPKRSDEPTMDAGREIAPGISDARAFVPTPVADPAQRTTGSVSESVVREITELRVDPAVPATAVAPAVQDLSFAAGPAAKAVTNRDAERVARRELEALRACTNIPGAVIAELDIALGRATVAKLNRHAPSEAVSWHGCAQEVLERLEYPRSDGVGRVRVRLTLE